MSRALSRIDAAEVEKPQGALDNLIQVSGVIKWFDAEKGYGYITPDGGGGDILIRISRLERKGIATLAQGTRLSCTAQIKGDGKVHAEEILSITEFGVLKSSAKISGPPSDWVKAVCARFNEERGYGFLEVEGLEVDVFVHIQVIKDSKMSELKPGQKVSVRYGDSPKGLLAVQIRPDLG